MAKDASARAQVFCGKAGTLRRIGFLDGLRGWGAIFVLLYHVCSQGFPINPAWGPVLGLLLPFNGKIAVMVFFLVSGFSLSAGYLETGDLRSWLKILAGRYIRLAIPIFAACAVVHMAMLCGLILPPNQRTEAFRNFLLFAPTLHHLLKFSLLNAFFHYRDTDTYILPLWTMSFEFFGSLVVLFAILLLRKVQYRSLFLLALAAVLLFVPLFSEWEILALFPIGAVIADAYKNNRFQLLPVFLSLALLLAGVLIPLTTPDSIIAWGVFGAGSLVIGCIAVPQIRTFLGGPFSARLGRISFPLYLMHAPIMWIAGEQLAHLLGPSPAHILLIDVIVIVLSLAAAFAFTPINEGAIWAAHKFGRVVVAALMPDRLIVAPSKGSMS